MMKSFKKTTTVLLLVGLSFSSLVFAQNATTVAPTPTPASAAAVQCVVRADCSDHGSCENGQCVCEKGYITFKDGKPCAYEQKEQLTAFLLSFFVGWTGADRFYTGHIGMGVGKLILTVAGIPLTCIGCCVGFCSGGEGGAVLGGHVGKAIGGITMLAGFGWWLADVILFGTNKVKEGNGAPLKKW